jgi:hypothetical protein
MRTILFEKRTGQDISKIKSIEQVNKIVEDRSGRPLAITRVNKENHIISRKGNIFEVKKYNLEEKINHELH